MLVVLIFGWTGGKILVGSSYKDAKVKASEMKASRGKKGAEPATTKRTPRQTTRRRTPTE